MAAILHRSRIHLIDSMTFADFMATQDFVVIGHRGAAGLAPENTLAGFSRALDEGCRMVELDVHCLADTGRTGELGVIHDAELDRTTNARGVVSNLALKDLARIDAGGGQPIPGLGDVLDLLVARARGGGAALALNIELKGKKTGMPVARALARRTADIHDLGVLVSSFDHEQLVAYRKRDPKTAVAPLYERWSPDWLTIAHALNASAVNLSTRIATPARINAIREAGFQVFVYTVNELRSALRLQRMGVSGVFTDRPDRMKTLI